MKKTFFTTNEVKEFLGISTSKLYQIRKKLSMFSDSYKKYYSQKDIEMIVEELKKENKCHF